MKISFPASSANLGPGFDTLGIALDIRNEAILLPNKFNTISLAGYGANNPYFKKNNFFVNIFREIIMKYSPSFDKFYKFKFTNHIPLSGGFGSSSVVLLSAITAAYNELGFPLDKKKILKEALSYESHPDNIAAAMYGGFIVSFVDNGGEVFVQRKEMPKHLKALMAIPNKKSTNTNQSRSKLHAKVDMKKASFNIARSSYLSTCFFTENWNELKLASKDRLHQNARMKAIPELFSLQKVALNNGALMSTLSGSGASFFNLCYKEDIPKIKNKLENRFKDFKFIELDFDNKGLSFEE